MKKVLIYLDDSVGSTLVELAKSEHRSVKAMAEKIVIDYIEGIVEENEEVRV